MMDMSEYPAVPPAMKKRKVDKALAPPTTRLADGPGGFDAGDGVVIPPLPDNPYAQSHTMPDGSQMAGPPMGGAPGANAGGGPSTPDPAMDSGFFKGLYDAGVQASGGGPPGGLAMPGMGFGAPVNNITFPGSPRPLMDDTSSPGGPRSIGNNGMGGQMPSAPLYAQGPPDLPGPMPGQGPGPNAPGRRFPRATSLIPRNVGPMRNGY